MTTPLHASDDSDGNDPAVVARAAALLAGGGLVAFPTETVYGLGARADDDAAVAKIFRLKGRPANHPLIVHVADAGAAARFAAELPPLATRLIEAFWPGPVTLILKRAEGLAAAAAGGQATIGLRCPSHPVAQALLKEAARLGVLGIAAPSANRFGRVSPTCAAHVRAEFGDAVTVLDGGISAIGIESSIVDCSRGHPVLLRPGLLTRGRIEAAAGEPLLDADPRADADLPRAPGTLASHYAPEARVRLMPTRNLTDALQCLGQSVPGLAVYSRVLPPGATAGLRHRRMPARPDQVAHELFSVLRAFDAEGMQLIWVEEPPTGPEWDGVRDRLLRAAAS